MEGHFDPLPQDGFDFDALHRWLATEPVTINRLTTGALSVATTLSGNYDGGAGTGWYIAGDGSAFFGADVTFAGDLYSDNWNGTVPVNLASEDTGATAGWALDSSVGSAQFEGNIYLGGSLLLDGNGKIATDVSPNERIEITSYANGSLRMWAGSTNETLPFQLSTTDVAGYPRTELYFNSYSGGNRVRLWGGDGGTPAAYFGAGGAEEVHLDFGQVWLEPGTAGLPAVAKFGDSNTGIFFRVADEINLTAGGNEKIRVTATEVHLADSTLHFGLGSNDILSYNDTTKLWQATIDGVAQFRIGVAGSGYGSVQVNIPTVGLRAIRAGAANSGPGGAGRALYVDN